MDWRREQYNTLSTSSKRTAVIAVTDIVKAKQNATAEIKITRYIYPSKWLNALADWASVPNTYFFQYHPDLTTCSMHGIKLAFKLRLPNNKYHPRCNVCTVTPFEEMVIKPKMSLKDSRDVWLTQFEKIMQQKTTSEEDALVEQAAWINNQHHCWEYAERIRNGETVSLGEKSVLLGHYSDSLSRHGKQLAKFYCVKHEEFGEMLPLRRREAYHSDCMICLKDKRAPELTRYSVNNAPTQKSDFTLNGDGREEFNTVA